MKPVSWPISLSDAQLQIVMTAAASLAPERRSQFLERVVARLRLKGCFNDADIDAAVRLALYGLIQTISVA